MSRRRRILLILAAAILIAASVILTRAALDPLRRSESTIEAKLLREAPLGSSTEQVGAMIRRHGWKLSYPLANTGFYDQRAPRPREVGAKHFRASLGDYQGIPFKANVTAFWGFDENDKLIDLWVWKTWDGL